MFSGRSVGEIHTEIDELPACEIVKTKVSKYCNTGSTIVLRHGQFSDSAFLLPGEQAQEQGVNPRMDCFSTSTPNVA